MLYVLNTRNHHQEFVAKMSLKSPGLNKMLREVNLLKHNEKVEGWGGLSNMMLVRAYGSRLLLVTPPTMKEWYLSTWTSSVVTLVVLRVISSALVPSVGRCWLGAGSASGFGAFAATRWAGSPARPVGPAAVNWDTTWWQTWCNIRHALNHSTLR